MTALADVSAAVLGIEPSALPLAPDEPGYDVDEFRRFLDEDADWRSRNPHVAAGPLRNAKGQIVAFPAYMRIDYHTNRNGPIPSYRPDLGPCWVWTAGTVKGYGYVRVGKRKVQAYRLNYERWVGAIPRGALIDHLCRVRACVRPSHLEPTTYSQNALRSPIHDAMLKAARDRCPEGHLFDEKNTRVWRGVRYCRACQAARKRRETGAQPRRLATDTHCANEHPWEGNLSILPSGKRQCLTCVRIAGQRFRDRKKASQLDATQGELAS